MKSVIGALRVNLGLDSAAFENGVKSAMGATKSLEKNLQGFATRSADLGKKLSLATAAMGAAAGAGLALAKSTASAAKEMDTQAKLANSSRREFQRWAAGSKTVGIEQDKLSDILKDVNDRVGDFIQTGGGPMADFFENIAPKVGVTADQFARLSGPEALQLYVSSLEKAGVSQQDMTFYMEAMASDATALVPLLQNGGAAMQELGDRAEQAGAVMSDSAVDSALRFQEALGGLGLAADGIRDRLGVAIIPLMTSLVEAIDSNVVPAIQGMIGHIEDAVKWFSDLPAPVKNATLAISGVAAIAGPALIGLGIAVSALAVGIGALASPVGIAVAAISGLAAGAVYLAANWRDLSQKFPILNSALDAARVAFDNLLPVLRSVGGFISDNLTAAFRTISQLLEGDFAGAFKTYTDQAMKNIGSLSGLADIATTAIKDMAGAFKSGLTSLANEAKTLAQRILDAIVSGLSGLYQAGVDALKDLGKGLREGAQNLVKEAKGWGSDIAAGLVDGMSGGRASAAEAARALADKTDEEFKAMLGIKSPSKVFRQHGSDITEGLSIGIEAGGHLPVAAISALAQEINSAAISGIEGLSQSFGSFVANGFDDFKGLLDDALNYLNSTIAQMIAVATKNKIMISVGLDASGFGATGGGIGGLLGGDPLAGALSNAGVAGVAGGGMLSGLLGSWGGSGGLLGGLSSVVGGLTSGGIGGAVSAIGSSLAGATTGLAGLAGAVGALAGPIGLAAAAVSFFTGKTKELDRGLRINIDSYDNLVDRFSSDTGFNGPGEEFDDAVNKFNEGLAGIVESYTKSEKSKFGGLSKKKKFNDDPVFGDDADAVLDPINNIITSVLDMAGALGVGGEAFRNFTGELWVSTKGLSDEEAQAAVAKALVGFTDSFAAMVPGLNAFALEGEGAATTLTRLSQSLGVVNPTLELLGHTVYDMSIKGAGAAATLAEAFGGLDQLQSATATYYDLFYSDAEKLRNMVDQANLVFAEFGEGIPASAQAYRDLIEAQNLNTEAGMNAYAALVQIAPMMDQIFAAQIEQENQRVAMLDTLANATGNLGAVTGGLEEQFAAVGMTVPTTTAGLIDAVKALDLTGEAASKLFAMLDAKIKKAQDAGAIADTGTSISGSTPAATSTLSRSSYSSGGSSSARQADKKSRQNAAKSERERLEEQLWRLQGRTDLIEDRERKKLANAQNRAIYDQIQALEKMTDALEGIEASGFATRAEYEWARARAGNAPAEALAAEEEAKKAAEEAKQAAVETRDYMRNGLLTWMKMLRLMKEERIDRLTDAEAAA